MTSFASDQQPTDSNINTTDGTAPVSSNDYVRSDRFDLANKEILFVTTPLSLHDMRRQTVSDAVCAVMRVVFDVVFVLAAVHFWRDGSIPALLDGVGGRWPWLVAGAVVGGFVFDEVPGALDQLSAACEDVLWAWAEQVPAPLRRLVGIEIAPVEESRR
jgi:hypothetical protein